MLENAKVCLSLTDFDELRNINSEAETIKQLIANAVEAEVIQEGDVVKGVTLSVDLVAIEKLFKKYHSFGKNKNEWINEAFQESDIVIKYKTISK